MEHEEQEVVSRIDHQYAAQPRPAGTRYRAQKRLVPFLVRVGFIEASIPVALEQPQQPEPAAPQAAESVPQAPVAKPRKPSTSTRRRGA